MKASNKVTKFYDVLGNWIIEQYKNQRNDLKNRPYIVGLNAPQGSGKTTLTTYLTEHFKNKGIPALAISIDDFYLTHKDQLQIAKRYSENTLLQQRGYPGTHDLTLGESVLGQLGRAAKIPRYDKSAFSGKGDRRPEDKWSVLKHSPQIVFVEGWMLGFEKQSHEHIDKVLKNEVGTSPQSFYEINDFLPQYKKWEKYFDAFIHLYVENTKYIIDWRIEAEEKMKASGSDGMSLKEVENYIKKFTPAYKIYVPQLIDRKFNIPHIKIEIQNNRIPA
ncbi:MAG: hypothetical protein HOO06_14175 [Bdellovibrionaceae bacterium]|jgi:D-glycerate 3-kinase|nr:hypothetical protein [Pseudobdellovibrionaceae bacterium]